MKSPITTHILDTTLGKPAAGISVVLEMQNENGGWKELARGTTNSDGRIFDLLPENFSLEQGFYSLIFDTKSYYQALGLRSLYPVVPIIFEIENPKSHFHIPLLLSPFGYSTYRGS